MTEFVPPFDLGFLKDGMHLDQLIVKQFNSPVVTISKVGQGFYAHVYKVRLEADPREVIVKCHKYAGRGEKEKAQLEVLRRHATVRVPRVYSLHHYSQALPCEALMMEYIPGVNASQVQFPDERLKARFVQIVPQPPPGHGGGASGSESDVVETAEPGADTTGSSTAEVG